VSTAGHEAWRTAVATAISRSRRRRRGAPALPVSAERALFELADSLGLGVTAFDGDERLCFIGRTATDYFASLGPIAIGTPFREILFRSLDKGAVTETPAPVPERAREMIGAGAPVELRLRDGRVLSGRTRKRESGGWVEFWSDVTDARRREAEAHESEARYKALSEAASEGILFDDHGIILDANRAAAEMFGFTCGEETRGRHLEEFLGAEHRGVVRQRTAARREDRAVYRAFHRDGREMWIEAENRFITSRGRPVSLVCFRDVTEHRRAEEALRAAKETAERADAAKSDFVRMVSHEIRNPLNAVLGMLRLMVDDELSPAQRARALTALTGGEAMIEILNDLLDIARMEAGALTLDDQPFDLVATLEETLELLGPQAAARGLALAGAATADVPPRPLGDAGRIRQILINLVGNALKYTESGGVSVLVQPVSRPDLPPGRRALSLTVEDSGVGISPEEIEHLFRPFGRSVSATGSRPDGLGLGLTITRRLAEMMGGSVDVESRPGRGSRFTAVVVLGVGEEATGIVSSSAVPGTRVFLVDPCPITAAVRRALLIGAEMEIVSSVEDADAVLLAGPSNEGFQAPRGVRVVRATDGDGAPISRRRLLAALGGGDDRAETPPVRSIERPVSAEGRPSLGTILVVDDSPTNRDVASAYLRASGYETRVAGDGREALAAARNDPPDLILMDITLPDMDGFAVAAALRAEPPPLGGVPIVAVTADAGEDARSRCLSAGMNDHVAKPIDRTRLAESVERLLARAPAIDPAPIERLIADLGRETTALMLRECVRENATRAERLASGVSDLPTATRDAHTLKSTAGTFGMRALEAAAREIEAAARLGDAARARSLSSALPDLARAAEERLSADGRFDV